MASPETIERPHPVAPGPGSDRVCVIGAGSSGIAACQVLAERGIPFDCFEKGSEIGGNWRYLNDNEMSSAYRSLHINTSKGLMAYSTFPMPHEYPDYPDHWQIARYFDQYVDHFGLRDRITFRTEVTAVEPADGGAYRVDWREREGSEGSGFYRAVLVANGHHWDPRWPEPPFPGSGSFEGEQLHAHHYKEPGVLGGKRVLVLGIGNSAVDIALDSSRVADRTFLAMRRGAHVIPKFLRGRPIDKGPVPSVFSRLPLGLQRLLFTRELKVAQGEMSSYGLPEPDHKLLEAHPTVSSELLPRLGHGEIGVKANIESFPGGRAVRFVDGSVEEIDLAIYCTGYRISFPFFDPDFLQAPDNRLHLYRRVIHPDHPGLFFIGFVQPLGAIMPIAEEQSRWAADILEGTCALPGRGRMEAAIEREQRRMAKRYVSSKRHTIQVDFYPYLRTVARERRAGRRRRALSRVRSGPV
jgi:dimethylaniline monooxygenase (N-oxide forming)